MPELHLFIQKDNLLAKLSLPTTWEQIRIQLGQQDYHKLMYSGVDNYQCKIFSEQSLKEAYQNWSQTFQPTIPMKVQVIDATESHSFRDRYSQNVKPIFQQISHQDEQEKQKIFRLTHSTENLDELDNAKSLQCSQIYPELFPLFFDESEKIPCRCVKSLNITTCINCNGSQAIDVTPQLRIQIEQMLQSKINQKFEALKKLYKDKWDIELKDMAHFVEQHQLLVKKGVFNPKKQDLNTIKSYNSPMTPQPQPQQKQNFFENPNSVIIPKPPKNINNNNNRRQSIPSTISSHSGKSTISNNSQLKYANGKTASPNEKSSPNTLIQRKMGHKAQTSIKIPSGRQSAEMVSSQRSVQNQQTQSPLNQSGMGSVINSQMSQYSAYLKDICIENDLVEPMATVYFKVTLSNNGAYQWPDTVMINRIDGDVYEKSISPLDPQEEKVIQIQFIAPQKEGTYQAEWRLCYKDENKEKEHFGPRFKVEFKVKQQSSYFLLILQDQDKKKIDFMEYLSNHCDGDKYEMEIYVVRRISEKPNLEKSQFVNLLWDDLQANPNIFKTEQTTIKT